MAVSPDSTDAQIKGEIACFGELWDPTEHICHTECLVQLRCLQRLAGVTLPNLAKEIGSSLGSIDVQDLAARQNIASATVEYVLAFKAKPSIGLAVVQDGKLVPMGTPSPASPPVLTVVPPAPPPPQDVDTAASSNDVPLVEVPKKEKPPKALKKPKAPKQEAEALVPMDAAPAVAKLKPAKKLGAGVFEKNVQPPKPSPRRKFQKLGSGAGRPLVAERVMDAVARPWGDPEARHARELKRRVEIAAVPIGGVVCRAWHGKEVSVTRRKGHWEHAGVEYPTLYSVMIKIVGEGLYAAQQREDGSRPEGQKRMPAWSATRFWNLGTAKAVKKSASPAKKKTASKKKAPSKKSKKKK